MPLLIRDSLPEKLVDIVLANAGIAPLLPELPAGVEVSIREADDRKLMFVQNTGDLPTIVSNVPPGTDLLTSGPVTGKLQLEPYGCAVIRLTD